MKVPYPVFIILVIFIKTMLFENDVLQDTQAYILSLNHPYL